MATVPKKAKKAGAKKETPFEQVVGILEKVAAESVAPGSVSVTRDGGSTTIEYTEVAFSVRGDGTRIANQTPVKVEV